MLEKDEDFLEFQVSSVSDLWNEQLVSIDARCNPAPWTAPLFAREFINPCARIRGLFYQDSVIGFLIGHIVFDEAHIVSLGVLPEHRRKGGGQRLLADFVRICRMEGVSRLTLQVRRSNTSARRLYVRNEFTNFGIRRNYYSDNGEDAITMGRHVAP